MNKRGKVGIKRSKKVSAGEQRVPKRPKKYNQKVSKSAKDCGEGQTGLSLGYEFRKKSDFGPMHSNSTILVGFFPTGSILRLWPSSQSWNQSKSSYGLGVNEV